MSNEPANLPLSTVAMVFGMLSIPLAFARHLVSLALVLALLGLVCALVGRWSVKRRPARWTSYSVERARIGLMTALLGVLCSVVMWTLWARNMLF